MHGINEASLEEALVCHTHYQLQELVTNERLVIHNYNLMLGLLVLDLRSNEKAIYICNFCQAVACQLCFHHGLASLQLCHAQLCLSGDVHSRNAAINGHELAVVLLQHLFYGRHCVLVDKLGQSCTAKVVEHTLREQTCTLTLPVRIEGPGPFNLSCQFEVGLSHAQHNDRHTVGAIRWVQNHAAPSTICRCYWHRNSALIVNNADFLHVDDGVAMVILANHILAWRGPQILKLRARLERDLCGRFGFFKLCTGQIPKRSIHLKDGLKLAARRNHPCCDESVFQLLHANALAKAVKIRVHPNSLRLWAFRIYGVL
mmetsp:Transcript_47847/g.95139  ORF Transcript_47847/g.95139 Transcript_47847/m.95139 type:complete len:315 (-) Transcript_47847:1671-2615(-)